MLSSCVRCSRPLAVESATGLCPECARTAGAPASTPRGVPPGPVPTPFAPTATAAPVVEPADRTRTHRPGAEPAMEIEI